MSEKFICKYLFMSSYKINAVFFDWVKTVDIKIMIQNKINI